MFINDDAPHQLVHHLQTYSKFRKVQGLVADLRCLRLSTSQLHVVNVAYCSTT